MEIKANNLNLLKESVEADYQELRNLLKRKLSVREDERTVDKYRHFASVYLEYDMNELISRADYHMNAADILFKNVYRIDPVLASEYSGETASIGQNIGKEFLFTLYKLSYDAILLKDFASYVLVLYEIHKKEFENADNFANQYSDAVHFMDDRVKEKHKNFDEINRLSYEELKAYLSNDENIPHHQKTTWMNPGESLDLNMNLSANQRVVMLKETASRELEKVTHWVNIMMNPSPYENYEFSTVTLQYHANPISDFMTNIKLIRHQVDQIIQLVDNLMSNLNLVTSVSTDNPDRDYLKTLYKISYYSVFLHNLTLYQIAQYEEIGSLVGSDHDDLMSVYRAFIRFAKPWEEFMKREIAQIEEYTEYYKLEDYIIRHRNIPHRKYRVEVEKIDSQYEVPNSAVYYLSE